MNRRIGIFILLCAAAVLCADELFAQSHPERRHVRSGNKDYEKQDYAASEDEYRSAMIKTPFSYEAAFNLGDALYKQERFEEGENILGMLSEHPMITPEQRAKVFYNLGNTQFGQGKLQESAESYMQSLILNPDDLEAKYNLAYVQKLLEDQEGGGGGGDNDQDQDQNDDQQDQGEGDGQQDRDDNGQDDQDQDDDDGGDQPDQQDKPEQQPPAESNISMEDAEKMLDAVQGQEDKTREKMNEKKGAAVGKSGKNW